MTEETDRAIAFWLNVAMTDAAALICVSAWAGGPFAPIWIYGCLFYVLFAPSYLLVSHLNAHWAEWQRRLRDDNPDGPK